MAAGDVNAVGNVTILLQANTGTIANPNYITLGSTGVQAGGGSLKPWSIEAHVSGSSTNTTGQVGNGILQGQYSAIFNNAYHNDSASPTNAWVTLDNSLTGIDFSAGAYGQNVVSNPYPFGLVVAVTFSVGNINNVANMYQFQVIAD